MDLLAHDPLESLRALEIYESRERCEASLYQFLRESWGSVDPAPFVDGWHLQAIAEHLEAVSRGEIKRLLINIPPRHCKTILTSIVWQAWTWARAKEPGNPMIGPGVRFLFASYSAGKAQQDAVTARRLLGSKWYQDRWGSRFTIQKDRDNQEQFDTSEGGCRISTGIKESLGKGGIIKVIDDPHKTDDVESQGVIEGQIRTYDEVWRTRSNDPKQGAEVVIMQRLGEVDLSGHLLENDGVVENGGEFVHLCLPASYDPRYHCSTAIGWSDPRSVDGELLWPERFDRDWIISQQKKIGSFAFAGQYQQLPAPRGGGIIKNDWWKLWPPPEKQQYWTDDEGLFRYPRFDFTLAYLDTAFTMKEENAWCAMTCWGVFPWENTESTVLCGAWRARPTLKGLIEMVIRTCRTKKVDVLVIENKAGGQWVKQEIMTLMRGCPWSIVLDEPKGDKIARLTRAGVMMENGLVFAPDKEWAQMVIDEVCSFPKSRYADLCDTVAGALGYLRQSEMLKLQREVKEEADDRLRFRGNKPTLAEEYGA